MLNWLGNPKDSTGNRDVSHALTTSFAYCATDPDSTAMDAPETPAPVFAVRAFKHAIFGTPQTVQPKPPRRHSNNDTATRPRPNARPRMERPKSTADAQTIGKFEGAIEDEPLPSPTKGILLTPGTASNRRKTVSFGAHVLDNEGKRPMQSGLPDDCPGKFPSPWAKSAVEQDSSDEIERPRSRNKLTEALEQARDESAKRKPRTSKQTKPETDTDITLNFGEPRSDSGKYWKQEYDIYRERTTREVRKLVKRQKETKDYARKVDNDNTDLREELRRERKKVERLERRAAELEAQMREFHANLQQAGGSTADGLREEDRVRPKSSSGHRALEPSHIIAKEVSTNERPPRPQRRSWKTTANPAERDREPAKIQDMGRATPSAIHDDLISQGDDQAGLRLQNTENEIDIRPASPLKSLSVNTLTQDTRSIAISMGLQPPSPQREKRQDSPVRGPESPLPSPEIVSRAARRPPVEAVKDDDWSIQLPQSSPFQPDAIMERPNILTGAPVPINNTPSRLSTNKPPALTENVSPPSKPPHRNQENERPSATWNAMGAPPESRRVVSKETGKAIDPDRVERAKARLAAKNRQVS